jgi:hypothetical protein
MTDPTPEYLLSTLQSDLRYYNDYIQGLAHEIIDTAVSKYPIFVAHQTAGVGIGKQILSHPSLNTQWSINASVLEEFIKKNIITREKLADFRATYKDPDDYMCVFVMMPDGANSFVFLKYIQQED